ncbi:MAG TPA: hypothetical protein VFV67_18830 [Actinophytocola sp.]|uniref:hypothetical protein n=1 Tax=Actinophytocola sp. TaxID=1872138 RepID=UPI002DB74682|nr:hypothetical protein [Actinophytocola sp.]HEU5472707.1 hypothetical protein [Actinophytocola sp.]
MFMQDQLAAEETRRTSLEQRGLAVITSSGVLATLGFGSLALFRQRDAVPMPGPSAYLLVGGGVALLVAAILALVTNAPLRHRAINAAAMVQTMREHWADHESTARARVTSTTARLLATARSANDLKALLLLAAMSAEVLGVALLAATLCVVIIGSR